MNAKTDGGVTVLHSAAYGGSLSVARYLIEEHGLDVNATTNGGSTVLHDAAYSGSLELVRYLVEDHGLDVNATKNNGTTARDLAVRQGHTEVSAYLASVAEREKLISIGKWQLDQEVDPLDDTRDVFAMLPSEDYVRDRSGALLAIVCFGENNLDVQLVLQGVRVKYEYERATHVIWRFDKLDADSGAWMVSEDREVLHPLSKVQWAKAILGHSKLFVRIKPMFGRRGEGDFLFDLRGVAKAVEPVRRACGW